MIATALVESAPKTMTDSVYHRIREDIIQGIHAPETKLKIEQLKKTYNVGATPIREALSRLSSDGFVITEGQRGFKSAPISTKDLQDVTDLRVMLETQALRKSIQQGDDAWESRVVAAFYQLTKAEKNKTPQNLEAWEQRNREFHEALISACTSDWLIRFYHVLYDQHKRYRNISITASTRINSERDLHAEHQRIYDAAIARDVDTACAETENHIRKTATVSLQVLEQRMHA
jgi:GntR family transcriptional regulator, carbon starvation induced regulator